MSIWSASSARRARSRASCSASAAPATRSAARPRAGCSRCRATSSSNARRCSTASAAASSTGSTIPEQPLDVLAQQIVAEVAAQEWSEDELFALFRRAWPYRALPREDFAAVVRMLAEGFSTRRGRRGALIHHDAVNHMLRGRRGARLTALTSGGTIPDNADYQVLLEPENQIIGTVNEDFAVESLAGDIFQLGNTVLSHPARRARHGARRGRAGHAADHPVLARRSARPQRRAVAVGVAAARRDRRAARRRSDRDGSAALARSSEVGIAEPAAEQLVEYLAAGHAALGCLPTQDTLVLERFFDEAGGMQLVIHSPFGSRINRAWGLALRKRFCRKFNFELQAAATEDNIVLSLTTAHSFELADVARYLHSATVRDGADPGAARRADVHDALALGRRRRRWRCRASAAARRCRRSSRAWTPRICSRRSSPTRSPAPRTSSASARSPTIRWSARRSPIAWTRRWTSTASSGCWRGIEAGDIRVVARDLTEPSPLALEVLSARPYAYLDDAPLEERRTQAVMSRRWLAPEDARRPRPARSGGDRAGARRGLARSRERRRAARRAGLARLSHATTKRRPSRGWSEWLDELARDKPRRRRLQAGAARRLWIAAERLPQFQALWPDARARAADRRARRLCRARHGRARRRWSRSCAAGWKAWGRSRQAALAAPLGLEPGEIAAALAALEAEGFAMRGRFTPGDERRGMVRAPAAGAHPPLHGQAPARRDRAGRGARLPALPVRLAARDGRRAHGGPGRARRRGRPARRLRGAGRRLGDRDPAGAARATTSRPGSTTTASPDASPGRGCGRATAANGERARRVAGAHDADHPARAPPRAAVGVAVADERAGAARAPRAQAVARRHPRSTAPRSSTSWSKAPACCAPQVEEALANWSRSALSPPTASAACARCWCRRTSASRPRRRRRRAHDVRHGGRRPLGAGPPRRAEQAGDSRRRGGRACRAHAAAPLRRRVLAPARARGAVAAAVARPAARLSPARGARRDPRRPLRRRLLRRAIRAARSDRPAARDPPQARDPAPGSRCPAPTR